MCTKRSFPTHNRLVRPIESWRHANSSMCDACADKRYRQLKNDGNKRHGHGWKTAASFDDLMRQAETPLDEDEYAKTHVPITEAQAELQRIVLSEALGRQLRGPRSTRGWAGVRRQMEGMAWAVKQK